MGCGCLERTNGVCVLVMAVDCVWMQRMTVDCHEVMMLVGKSGEEERKTTEWNEVEKGPHEVGGAYRRWSCHA